MNQASGNESDVLGVTTLTDRNTVGSAAGKLGNSRDFERSNSESFDAADNANVSMGDIAMSGILWVNLESNAATMVMLCKGTDVTSTTTLEYSVYFTTTSGGRFVFRVRGGSTNTQVSANNFGAPSTGTWYMIYFEHDPVGNTIGISVNNGTLNTASHTAGIADGTGTFYCGWDADAARYYDGLIDEVHIFKKRLDSSERAALYNGGNALAYPWIAYPRLVDGGLAHHSVLLDSPLVA
jgi:hypothetical protein